MTNENDCSLHGHQVDIPVLGASMRTRAGGYQSPGDGITYHIRPFTNKRARLSSCGSLTEEMPAGMPEISMSAFLQLPSKAAQPSLPRGTSLDDLPDDIVILIMTHLIKRASRSADLINTMLTCRRLCGLATQEGVLLQACPAVLAVPPKGWSDGAHRFLRKCSQAGNMEATFRLGMIKFYCLEDRRGGATLMARAAMAGHLDALHSLAIIHFNGSGGARSNRDLSSGVVLCAKAAAQGHVEALRELGHCLQDGYGLPRNVSEGRRLLLEANAREAAQWVYRGALPPPRLHPDPPTWARGVAAVGRRRASPPGEDAARGPPANREASGGPGAGGSAHQAEGDGAAHERAAGQRPGDRNVAAGAAVEGRVPQGEGVQNRHARPAYVRTVSGPIPFVPSLGLAGMGDLNEAEGKGGETAASSAAPSASRPGAAPAGPAAGGPVPPAAEQAGGMVPVEVRAAAAGRWLGVPQVPPPGANPDPNPELTPRPPSSGQPQAHSQQPPSDSASPSSLQQPQHCRHHNSAAARAAMYAAIRTHRERLLGGLAVRRAPEEDAAQGAPGAARGEPAAAAPAEQEGGDGAAGPPPPGQAGPSSQLGTERDAGSLPAGAGQGQGECATAHVHPWSTQAFIAAAQKFTIRTMCELAGPQWPPCCVLAGIGVPCGCHLADELPSIQKFLVEWHRLHPLPEGLRPCTNARCGRPETRKQEFRCCSACGRAKYCSRACQAHDWKAGHKTACGPPAPLARAQP